MLGFPLGFFASGYFSGIGAFLTELYPTRLRGSARAFATISAAASARCFRSSSARCRRSTSLANAIAIFAVVAYALFFIAAFALPETRGRVLHADCTWPIVPGR